MLRKHLLILALAAGLPAVALAMPENCPMEGHGNRGGHHGGGMHHDMDLSAEQKRDMRQLMRQQHDEQREIVQRYLDKLPEAQRKAMAQEQQASRDATHQAMRKLLDAEQQKQFDAMAKDRELREKEWAEFQKWKAEQQTKQ